MRWQPSATLDALRQRAVLMQTIRTFFLSRQYLEVETPIMGQYGVTDVYLANIKATFRQQSYCLQTSPEYHMKRLLAAGSGPIFQLARVFRDDELGRWHNPEFTLLEWYQLGVDHHQLMDEVDAFLKLILNTPPLRKKTYQQAFLESCALDPFNTNLAELKACLARFGLAKTLEHEQDKDMHLFLLMSHVVEPFYAQDKAPLAIYDFPASQAALAQINGQVAERFEIYYQGVELANGFHELTNAASQRQRFAQDIAQRHAMQLPEAYMDEYLLGALEAGLPACSGVALGVDRLIACALKQNKISQVLAFDIQRA
ncbi:MAG: elongation factor P lysine(34) lysyltransferase [Legionellaceae bacterium]|nr:elongation factor P lysine(34) lysyltransferase [Legionellaceae bacterium]HAF87898.1 elongation factor P lysine(34) lysyltransferase [Legionellales bacterium]HCA89329.1 elongation factor P lysine(34) lysyltransferase [Legionellales bacterium]|tara:strand:- start:952 stop:1893 length:942 start_codon:yes stop_codon:yes gene_type:complete